MTTSEIQPQTKREPETPHEPTTPDKRYVPATDIYETPDALHVVMDMPGVPRDGVEVTLDRDHLTIEGRVDYTRYDGLHPLYTEYNVGHFTRSFTLSRQVDRGGITAQLTDGVLTLRLPVAADAKPRRIPVG